MTQGSPPHTWRILNTALKCTVKVRITSTHVENTGAVNSSGGASGDHLHTRGEYSIKTLYDLITVGSPPHTWRIRILEQNFQEMIGITSTHVENTFFCVFDRVIHEDHLHTRGEYTLILLLTR